jgi:hypothetical protein
VSVLYSKSKFRDVYMVLKKQNIISLIWDNRKCVCLIVFYHLNRSSMMNILKVLVDATLHSEHGRQIRCDIGEKPVECSELECLMWWTAIRKYTFKIEHKIKRWLYSIHNRSFWTCSSNQMRLETGIGREIYWSLAIVRLLRMRCRISPIISHVINLCIPCIII